MLTSDLLRYRAKKKTIIPTYLDTSSEQAQLKASQLTEIFEQSDRASYDDIAEQVTRAIGYGTDFLVWRGLAKLLYDRSEFETVSEVEPVEIRRAVFEASNELGPVTSEEMRQKVLDEAATRLGAPVEAIEQGLYADLQARQLLTSYKKLKPAQLLDRYNLAQAQGILYKATRMEIWLGEQDANLLRYLFQMLKFHGLMHRLWKEGDTWRVEVDGPASLLRQSRKYGLKMAIFLPALVLMEKWRMVADLDWGKGKKDYKLELSNEDGLVSHYRARGQWISDEEKMLEDRFSRYETEWELERRGTLLELEGGQVLVPDYVLRHPDGRVVFMEVIGFWRKSYLERRLEALAKLEDTPLVLVLSKKLNSDQGDLAELPASCVFFKTVILIDQVLAAAESFFDESD